jgi:hypothetical protein
MNAAGDVAHLRELFQKQSLLIRGFEVRDGLISFFGVVHNSHPFPFVEGIPLSPHCTTPRD